MKDEIDQIILGFTKSFKAMQMYGMSHSSFLHFFEPFYQILSNFLKEHNEFSLEVEKFGLIHNDRIVYEEEEMDMSIAFRLFKDGIRSIAFLSGLTSDELLLFIDVISRPAREWDIALGLWECNFAHITFYVIETDEVLDYQVPEVPAIDVDYDEKLKQLILKEKIDIDAVIIPELNPQEIENLKSNITDEERAALLPIVIKTLGDYLQTECSQEIIDGLIEILQTCVNVQDFRNARRICYKLKDYPDVNFIERFENETTIMSFREVLNVPQDEIFNEFLAFLGFFGKRSIPLIIQIMPFVERSDRLNALRHRIAHIAGNDVTPMIEFLESKDPDLLVNAIHMIGIVKPANTDKLFEPFVYHKDENVRMATVDALAAADQPAAIVKFVTDPAVEVRVRALCALGRQKCPEMYPVLLDRIKQNSFLALDFSEQREVFNYLAAHGDRDLVRVMRDILYKRKWFGAKKYRVMRRLAASTLSHINTAQALDILEKGRRKRNRDIAYACEAALKERPS
ncbi:hypothetical protein IBX73_03495 [candidate division WOR-3 bacterium]|nr:hypothetical protein [candidate division WOR-3 bacterium]